MKTNSFLAAAGVSAIFTLALMGCNKNLDEVMQTDPAGLETARMGSRSYCESKGQSVLNPSGGLRGANLRAVVNSETVYNTDYVSAGVGGLRNETSGTLLLAGVSGPVTKAYLYWHGNTTSSTEAGGTITFAGQSITGTNIGISSTNCWGAGNSQAYRADVTTIVQGINNGNYAITDYAGSINLNGASLLVFFNDGDNTNNRDIVLFEGNDSNEYFPGIPLVTNAPEDAAGWNVALNGINYTMGSAIVELHVGDGQFGASYVDGAVEINGTTIAATGAIFSGNSVPAANNGPLDNGSLWDIKSWDVTTLLSAGLNDLNLISGIYGDCLSLVVAAINLPAGAAPVDEVFFDMKPMSCPSTVRMNDKGVLPAAILGTAGFDVSRIDLTTLMVNGISPVRTSYEDVTAPYLGEVTDCMTCNTAEPDGFTDLAIKFDTQAFTGTLPGVMNNDCVEVTITGNFLPEFGGGAFTGKDIIRIVSK